MAAPLVFRREWIVQINEMLNHDDDNPLPNTPAILRVPTPLLEMKPEAYLPQLLSFGPYHHSKLEKAIDSDSPCAERNISMAEAYKGKFAVMLSKKLRYNGKSFKFIVERMKLMRPKIESFYRWPTSTDDDYSQNFALMMAIDSSFLLQVFMMGIFPFVESTLRFDDEMESFITIYHSCICHDIEKMENQIPLFVLKDVFDYVKEALIVRPVTDPAVCADSLPFNHLLRKMCDRFSPFQSSVAEDIAAAEDIVVAEDIAAGEGIEDIAVADDIEDIAENECNILIDAMAKEPHLLGCFHNSLSLVLHMQPRREEHHRRMRIPLKKLVTWILRFLSDVPRTELLFPNGMSAGQLDEAGIKFKSFSKMSDYIGLDTESGTLYLPHIIVGEIGTEVWLRNMLALEFNDALRPKYVTRYVALMGTLVQSPHDVRFLVDRQLISRDNFSLTDECIAQMWHDLRQPFLTDSMTEVHRELHQKLNEWFKKIYWKKKIARKVCGVYEYVLSWKFIAPLAAFLGLLMTAIQTYCSLYHCS